jgi:hypothetical protein
MPWKQVTSGSTQIADIATQVESFGDSIAGSTSSVLSAISVLLNLLDQASSLYVDPISAAALATITALKNSVNGLLDTGMQSFFIPVESGGKDYLIQKLEFAFTNKQDPLVPDWESDNGYVYALILFGGSLMNATKIASTLGRLFSIPSAETLPPPTFDIYPRDNKVDLVFRQNYIGDTKDFSRRIIIERRQEGQDWVVKEEYWNSIGYTDYLANNDIKYFYRIQTKLYPIGVNITTFKSEYSEEKSAIPKAILGQLVFGYAQDRWMGMNLGAIPLVNDFVVKTNEVLDSIGNMFVAVNTNYQKMIDVITAKILEIEELIISVNSFIQEFLDILIGIMTLPIYFYYTEPKTGTAQNLYQDILSSLNESDSPYFLGEGGADIKGKNVSLVTQYFYNNRPVKILAKGSIRIILEYLDTGEQVEVSVTETFKEYKVGFVGGILLVADAPDISGVADSLNSFKAVFD